MLRIGHKGAAALAEGNTLASFDAALAAGVDAIEFDVLSEHPGGAGRLLLAHDRTDLRAREPVELGSALEYLSAPSFAHLGLDVDVKQRGYCTRVARALRGASLLERSLVCGTHGADLEAARTSVPELRLGLTLRSLGAGIPLDRAYRRTLPGRLARLLRAGRFQAILPHWRLVTTALIEAVHSNGGQLHVWTVDERPLIEALSAMGVDGIITNDPRLFASDGATSADRAGG